MGSSLDEERLENIRRLGQDVELLKSGLEFLEKTSKYGYTYNFDWLGRPIIQVPQDIVALQELFWLTRPDVVIETGIAHGGSLVLSASLLALLDYCDAVAEREMLDPTSPRRRVLGIDIEIRKHNREAIEAHPMCSRIELVEGSSTADDVVARAREFATNKDNVLVILDSNHTHEHVLAELEAYAPLVTAGSYCVVLDTAIEDMPDGMFPDRPWGKGDNPKTAVWAFLEDHPEFEIDRRIHEKLLITVAPDGFLRRVS